MLKSILESNLIQLCHISKKKKKKICSLFLFPMSSLFSSISTHTPAQSSRGKEVMERTCNLIPKDLSSNDALLPLNFSGPQFFLSVKRNKGPHLPVFLRVSGRII